MTGEARKQRASRSMADDGGHIDCRSGTRQVRKIVVYSGRRDPVSHNIDDAPVERLAQHPELGGLFAMACGQDVPAAFPRFFTIEDWLRGRTTDQVERDERGH